MKQSPEAAFRLRVAELGGTVLEPVWLGKDTPHRVLCSEGHETTPRPNNVRNGKGICRTCAGRNPQAAEATFRARLVEFGATLLEPSWLGVNAPHRILCAEGHECAPRPTSLQQGTGLCRACAGRDPLASEAEFRARLTEAGAVLLESGWRGSSEPHRVRCAEGHTISPSPNGLRRGDNVCRVCAGRAWDVLYVVIDDKNGILKFGITTGTPRRRLSNHRFDGFNRIARLLSGLPSGGALDLERAILHGLRDAGERPVRGREYFPTRVLPLVLGVIDRHPTTQQAADA